jgi:hypothetical protein
MMNKTCYNLAQLQAEKKRINELSKIQEIELNQKLIYLQDNLLPIMWHSVAHKRDGKNAFTEIFNNVIGLNTNDSKGNVLLNLVKTILPTLAISLIKNYFTKK